MALSQEQIDLLLRPIDAGRVQHLRGMSHLEAWDVRRWLIRIFGFEGFTIETVELACIREAETQTRQGKPAWNVAYRAQVRLTLKDKNSWPVTFFEDAAAGDSTQPSYGDCHDMAMKTALSQALKRCVVNLGDQFGLSLYNNGSVTAQVGKSIAYAQPVDASRDEPVRSELAEANHDQWVDMAESCSSADEVVKIYKEANDSGAHPDTLAAIRSVGEVMRAGEKAEENR